MKILYVVHQFFPTSFTGGERATLNAARMTQKAGHQVHVLTWSWLDDEEYGQQVEHLLFRRYIYRGVPVTAWRHTPQFRDDRFGSVRDVNLAKFAATLLEEYKPDLVHFCHLMRSEAVVFAAQRLRVPYVITLHDFFLICPKVNLITSSGAGCPGPDGGRECGKGCPELEPKWVSKRLSSAREIIESAGAVVAVSEFVAERFSRETSVPIQVIPLGVDHVELAPRPRPYGEDTPITFCFAGTLSPEKGVRVLVDAFRRLDSATARLRIYGFGSDAAFVQQLEASAGPDPRIELFEPYESSEVGRVFSEVDVVVIPSVVYETFSLVLHEALASNLPVVVSDVRALTDRVEDGGSGFVFSRGDTDSLRAVLRRIVDDPPVLNGVKRTIGKISIRGIAEEAYAYEGVYRQALAGAQ